MERKQRSTLNFSGRTANVRAAASFQQRRQFSATRTVVSPPTVPPAELPKLSIASRVIKHAMNAPAIEPELHAARTLGHKLKRMVATAGHAWQYEHMHLHEHLPQEVQHPLKTSRRIYIREVTRLQQTGAGKQAAPFLIWLRRAHAQTLVVSLLVFSMVAPIAQNVAVQHRYQLDAKSEAIIGTANKNLEQKLTYDASKQLYQFNKDGLAKAEQAKDPANPVAKLMAAQTGGGGKDSKQLYSLDISENLQKGVTVYDNNLGLSFKLVPQFGTAPGRMENGRLIYPVDGGQVVYSLKGNGLKEDVLLSKAPKDGRFDMSYHLDLPQELEAKLMPDGGIGIYSADPALFGDISFGDKATEFSVMQSRKTGAKTNLVFALPAPVIRQSEQDKGPKGVASFQLHGDELSLQASQLEGLSYPLSIDPTVVVTSTSDFATGNNEGNIDYPANQINRGALTGGTISGGWASAGGAFTNARHGHASVAYNGYIYLMGGDNTGVYYNDVQYALLCTGSNSGVGGCGATAGTIGTWASANTGTSFTNVRYLLSAVAYNGYLYILGGGDSSNKYNDVQYVPINSTGTLGTWASTSSFTTTRIGQKAVAYNGYMYVLGGLNGGSTYLNDVQYAPINGNGTLGAWHYTHSSTDDSTSFVAGFTTARYNFASIAYNGYLYVIGGGSGGTYYNDVQYAPINANGTIGAWATTSTFTTARADIGIAVNNGYVYITGGYFGDFSGDTYYPDVQYAPINANGSLGTWNTATNLSTGRADHTTVVYNGYLYVIGGNTGSEQTDTQYAKIDPAGATGAYTANGTSVTAIRAYAATVAYNGFLYVMGGESATTPTCQSTTYYAPISANGSIGTWVTSTNTFTTVRCGAAAAAYNGYLYIFGGRSASTTVLNTTYVSLLNTTTGAPGVWAATGATTPYVARWRHNAVIYNGYAYIIGGQLGTAATTCNASSSVYCNDIAYAPITSTGTITTAWTTVTGATSGLTARSGARAVLNGNMLYVLGGETAASTQTTSIQYLTIASSGAPGSFSSTTTTFTTARADFGAVVYNGVLYIMGGINGASTYQSDMQYVPIASTGNITGTWTTGKAITTARKAFGAFAYNGYMYIVGGYHSTSDTLCNSTASNYCTDVKYAQINNGGYGTIGTWVTSSNNLTTSRLNTTTAAYNGYLYVIAGSTLSGDTDKVEYAPINADGSIGTWTQDTSSLTSTRSVHASVAYNGYLYALGGNIASGITNTVEYALICTGSNSGTAGCGSTAGALGTWTTDSGTSFTTPRTGLATVAYKGYMYVIAGLNVSTYLADVQYAPINSDGSIGTWAATTSLSINHFQAAAVAYNGYLYVTGGYDGGGSYLNTVEYALICTGSNSGTAGCGATAGTVGTWLKTTSFNMVRAKHISFAYDGYLYVTDGSNGSAMTNTQFAPINGNGTLGNWFTNPTNSANNHEPGVAYKGYIYRTAGGAGSYLASTDYAPLNSIPRIGAYSKLIDIGSSVGLSGITYTASGVSDANMTYKAWASDGTTVAGSGLMSAVTSSGGGGGSCGGGSGGGSVTARYVLLRAVIDDSQNGGVFADSLSTFANVADITVTYTAGSSSGHPPPNQRLHGGKVLQAGGLNNLQLDSCGV